MKFRRTILGLGSAAALSAMIAVAHAAGMFSYPQLGTTGSESALTGNELVPMDTALTQGQNPATITASVNQLGAAAQNVMAPRNMVIGGNFSTNPFQRGTSFVLTSATVSYTADRFWAVGGASSSNTISKQTGATDIFTGINASLRNQRTATSTDTAATCIGQVLESGNSIPLQGRTITLSFYALAGANFSPTAGNINVTLASGTGTDQSAANFQTGAWTNFSSLTLTPAQGTVTAAAGISQAVTTTWTRYVFSAAIPVAATQVGFKICNTPVGTAGTNDWLELANVQLETGPYASPFEFRPQLLETALAQRYFVQISEPASMTVTGIGQCISTTVCKISIPLTVTMRSAPTATLVTGTYSNTVAGGTAGLTDTLTSGTSTVGWLAITTTSTGTPFVAGNATQLVGGGGTGSIAASSEL